MNIARTTVTAIYDSARKKVADALVNGKRLLITGGHFEYEPVGVNDNVEKHNGMEHYKDNFIVFGERFAKKAAELFR